MGKGSSSADQSSTVYDQRIAAEDSATILKDVGNISVQSIDGDLIAKALGITAGTVSDTLDVLNRSVLAGADTADTAMSTVRGVAGDSNELARQAMEQANALTQTVLTANQSLADAVGVTASNTMTTLRDTLSATLGSDNLAGSAEQSGGAAGWISRNPALAALFAVVATVFAALVFFRKKQ